MNTLSRLLKSAAIFSIVLIVIVFSPYFVFAEVEPNEILSQASAIGIGYNNAERNASISATTDVDYYSFQTDANRTYVIEAFNVPDIASDRALGLYLYNASGTLLDQDRYSENGTGVADNRIVYTFSIAGTYYIRVISDLNYTGDYSLRILPRFDEPGAFWDAGDGYEPNDVKELAYSLNVGLTQAQTHQISLNSGIHAQNLDEDFFRFSTEANRTYVIETFNIPDVTGDRAAGLYLYNSTGTLLAQDRYSEFGSGAADNRIVYTFTTAGIYFIRVTTDVTWTGTYSIRVLPKYDEPNALWDATNDYEPNDVKELAYGIGIGANQAQNHQIQVNSGVHSPVLDVDYFRLEVPAAGTNVIETFNIPLSAGDRTVGLYLYNSSGTLLEQDRYSEFGINRANGRITYEFLSTGTYFIKVRTDVNYTGNYSLRVCSNSCSAKLYLPLLKR